MLDLVILANKLNGGIDVRRETTKLCQFLGELRAGTVQIALLDRKIDQPSCIITTIERNLSRDRVEVDAVGRPGDHPNPIYVFLIRTVGKHPEVDGDIQAGLVDPTRPEDTGQLTRAGHDVEAGSL